MNRVTGLRVQSQQRQNEQQTTYQLWRESHLAGLISTITEPDGAVSAWQLITTFEVGTPGLEWVNGERWFQAQVEGITIYRCNEGVAAWYYGPPALVYNWCLAEWARTVQRFGEPEAARMFLVMATPLPHLPEVDHAPYSRLVELKGVQHFVEIARQDEWKIPAYPTDATTLQWYLDVAWRYDLPHVVMEFVCDADKVPAVSKFQLNVASFWKHPGTSELYALTTDQHWVDMSALYRDVQTARMSLARSDGDSSIE